MGSKIHFLGTCSGTEPMPGMHHCSLIIEVGGRYYWFDAGEGCAHTVHTSGKDVLNTRAIFISHPHIDHIGGLSNLFLCIMKLISREKRTLIHQNQLDIFFPGLETLQAVKLIANSGFWTEMRRFELLEHEMREGLLFEDENVRVSAIHNTHLKEDGTNGWHSFSFLIEAEGKRIVFSGDVASPEELDVFVQEGCDILIMETGHHKVADVCEYAISRGVKKLCFNHHGREIINDREGCQKMVDDYATARNISIVICEDNMVENI